MEFGVGRERERETRQIERELKNSFSSVAVGFGSILISCSRVWVLPLRAGLLLTSIHNTLVGIEHEMKYNAKVTSSRRKQRKAHFTAPSSERRKIMSAPLSSELRKKYGCRSMPVRKEDEVRVARGTYKGKEGKVVQVYRKKWVIHVDKLTREKVNRTLKSLFSPLLVLLRVFFSLSLSRSARLLAFTFASNRV